MTPHESHDASAHLDTLIDELHGLLVDAKSKKASRDEVSRIIEQFNRNHTAAFAPQIAKYLGSPLPAGVVVRGEGWIAHVATTGGRIELPQPGPAVTESGTTVQLLVGAQRSAARSVVQSAEYPWNDQTAVCAQIMSLGRTLSSLNPQDGNDRKLGERLVMLERLVKRYNAEFGSAKRPLDAVTDAEKVTIGDYVLTRKGTSLTLEQYNPTVPRPELDRVQEGNNAVEQALDALEKHRSEEALRQLRRHAWTYADVVSQENILRFLKDLPDDAECESILERIFRTQKNLSLIQRVQRESTREGLSDFFSLQRLKFSYDSNPVQVLGAYEQFVSRRPEKRGEAIEALEYSFAHAAYDEDQLLSAVHQKSRLLTDSRLHRLFVVTGGKVLVRRFQGKAQELLQRFARLPNSSEPRDIFAKEITFDAISHFFLSEEACYSVLPELRKQKEFAKYWAETVGI